MKKITFVLAGDNNYTPYIETTLKSILYHHRNCKIYILNEDILPEWFRKVNKLAESLHSKVIDIKLVDENMEWESGVEHINKMGYARYFIPKYINEDVVLYLDSDIIINGSLNELFSYNIEDYYMAAIYDSHSLQYFGENFEYNSGFLLINNKLCREKQLYRALSEETVKVIENVQRQNWDRPFNGDQTIINLVCKDKILELPTKFNYQIGMERFAIAEKWKNYDKLKDPLVIHYVTDVKPWNSVRQFRFKELWWDYNSLDYSDIISNHYKIIPSKSLVKPVECFILTNSQDLEQIDYLVKSLPNYIFRIGAYTGFGSKALKLQEYPNVRLHPYSFNTEILELLENCDFYLNINHGGVVFDILNHAKAYQKTIVSFDNIDGREHAEKIFSASSPDEMVAYLLMKNI